MSRHPVAAAIAVAALLLTACGDDAEEADAGSDAGECPTVTEGTLTVATDSPAFPPWVIDDDPTTGEGYESAVAYAVAEELGFTQDQVEWVRVPFNNAFAPGDKDFDFDINQVSITPERAEAIDFSDGYYDANQAIIGYEDSEAAGATTIEDLQGLRLGAQVGTTSLDFILDRIQPTTDPFVYNDNAAAKAALDANQVDAIVLDLPTAFFVTSVEIEGSTIIGQFPEGEQFGMVFEKGNPLRDCVNEALAAVDLGAIEAEWLADSGNDAPVIELDG